MPAGKMRSKIAFALFLSIVGTFVLSGAETPSTALLVLSKGNHALMIVDPATLQVAGQAPSGPDPHEVIASGDGKVAYISNYGGGAYNTITVVDLVSQKNLPIIDLGPLRGPHGLEFVGGKLWFTAEGAKAIGSYDPAAQKLDWILGTGQNRTHMIFVSSDLKRIFTSNVSSGTISIIEKTTRRQGGPGPGGPGPGGPGAGGPPPPPRGPGQGGPPAADWDETVVRVGNGAEGFDVSRDGKEIWAANAQDGTISVIDVQSKKLIQTIDANVKSANRLRFTPDGTQVFVSMLGGPDLVVLDTASRKEVKRVKIGHGAAGILMDPDGNRAFLACTPDDYVAVVDLKSLEVTGHIAAGKGPDGLAWAVRGR
jgi:DNA-binding beta-propeller fold protein YncE